MDRPVYEWLKANLQPGDFKEARVLEVGSQDFNGSPRSIVNRLGVKSYWGVDFQAGRGVDQVLNCHDLVKEFGPGSFDAIISTEMLEHVQDWRGAINQMKLALKPGGILVITTRRPGFEQHGYPHDHWRFTVQNMRAAFVDFWVKRCEAVAGQGVVILVQKPYSWEEPASLAHIHPAPCPSKPYRGFRRLLWVKVAYRFQDPAAPQF